MAPSAGLSVVVLEHFVAKPRPRCQANRRCARHLAALQRDVVTLRKIPARQHDARKRRRKVGVLRAALVQRMTDLLKLREEMAAGRKTLSRLRRQNTAQQKRLEQRAAHLKALRTMR